MEANKNEFYVVSVEDIARAYRVPVNMIGLNDDEVNTMLSIDNAMEFSAQEKDELLLAEFAKCGVNKSDYLIVKTLPAKFTSQEFNEVNQLEANVLDLLRKDKRITPEIIAETLDIEE